MLIGAIFIYALFPFYWALRSAFTTESELFKTPVQYIPQDPTTRELQHVFSNDLFMRALLNSTIVAGAVTLIALALGSLAGYALGRFRFRGRSATLYVMLSMTIFPQIAILGALYTMINRFELYDSLRALVLSYMILVLPFTVWVLTSFMRALPRDLEEAAYVDGASPLQTFYCVMLPLVAPGLVTAGLLAFIAAWNEFLFALSFTQSPEKYTVPVAITSFTGDERLRQAVGPDHGGHGHRHRAADRAHARAAATDPRRPHRRRRQGLDRLPRLGIEEVEAARVYGELDLAALRDLAAGIHACDEPGASFLRARRRSAERGVVVSCRARDQDRR